MESVSPLSTLWFYGLVVLVGALFAASLGASGKSGETPAKRWTWRLIAAMILLSVLGISGLIAQSGVLRNFDRRPPPLMLLIPGIWIATTALAFSPVGLRLIRTLGFSALIGFQAFRFPLELLLHRLYREGVIPVQMTYSGYNFDIIAGISALGIGFWALRGRGLDRRAVIVWNVVGLALLMNIVTIAILSIPTPLRAFHNEPANTLVAEFPFIWLPAFLVQAAWFGHLLVFRKLTLATR